MTSNDSTTNGNNSSEELTNTNTNSTIKSITGLYQDWFLDYASYVILERAVPHINDGLKPVQRRILYSMKTLDDGRYNKVANIIGNTMQYHPHGDTSIGDALVQLGQKDLLIDTQGNWGNTSTGDGAAAARYIEARLSKFALEILFNPKTTNWQLSYDGRNKEPITLPVKFPLLLAQGVEGIAVGLASKILPHNFNELIEATIKYLRGKEFQLFPDFNSGGSIDVNRYNDGIRGGAVKIRAHIEKRDGKTLVIKELPFGKTTSSLIESVIKANERNKIKIKKIDDNTAENVEIIISLATGVSPDVTIDALYAFTDCEISISPNACIIRDEKPIFITVDEMLKTSADNTVTLLKRELDIKKLELYESLHNASLEKIFIENHIYLSIENCETWEQIIDTIDKGLKPFTQTLLKEITEEDIVRLTEIKIKRISKYDAFKADNYIKSLQEDIKDINIKLNSLIPYTIKYYEKIKQKYGKGKERKTKIRNFGVIEATQVVLSNEKLYINREEGFIGTSLKKDEYICDCSDIDDIIIFQKSGKYTIKKVTEKEFIGKDILHINIFKKNNQRTIYNVLYLDGTSKITYIKRFFVTSMIRDKEYHITQGSNDSTILYFSANPDGEAEILNVLLKPRPRLKTLRLIIDFSQIAIKGRNAIGNIATKNPIHKVKIKKEGLSTLGGQKIWFDTEIKKLNMLNKGTYLGEFFSEDKILVITKDGKYRISNFRLINHFDEEIHTIEKYDTKKIWTAVFFDAEQNYYYAKRFQFENTITLENLIGENPQSKLTLITEENRPRIMIKYDPKKTNKENEIIYLDEFIAVKSYRSKGKRLTTHKVVRITKLTSIKK